MDRALRLTGLTTGAFHNVVISSMMGTLQIVILIVEGSGNKDGKKRNADQSDRER